MEKMIDFDELYSRRGSDCKKYNPGKFSEDILPMWIADTDFRCPVECIEAAKERVNHECFGYPYELPEFNSAVKSYLNNRHGWEIEEDWVEFVTGVVPAAIFAIRAFTNPGDKVVVHTPLYPPLREAVRDNGRLLDEQSLVEHEGYYTIDFVELEKSFRDPRTKMYILVNPHNPVGRSWTREELEKLSELCIKYNIIVFNDEIHSDIIYGNNRHVCFHNLNEEIANLTITSSNPGKTFNVAGVRTAYVLISNKELRDKFLVSRKNNKAMGRTVIGQQVFIAAYSQCEYYVDQLVSYLEKNVNFVEQFISEKLPEIKFNKPEATYLMWLDCRELGLDQKELMNLFENVGKVGFNDGSSFGNEGTGFVRMNIAAPRKIVEEGLRRIEKAVQEWRNSN